MSSKTSDATLIDAYCWAVWIVSRKAVLQVTALLQIKTQRTQAWQAFLKLCTCALSDQDTAYTSVASFSQTMPCSQCDEWVDEWMQWRRYDHDVQHPRALRYWLSRYDGLWWFFFCSSCREREPWLKSWYVNADGGISTDSDTDSSEDLEPMSAREPEEEPPIRTTARITTD